jgi:hypothetical protein
MEVSQGKNEESRKAGKQEKMFYSSIATRMPIFLLVSCLPAFLSHPGKRSPASDGDREYRKKGVCAGFSCSKIQNATDRHG